MYLYREETSFLGLDEMYLDDGGSFKSYTLHFFLNSTMSHGYITGNILFEYRYSSENSVREPLYMLKVIFERFLIQVFIAKPILLLEINCSKLSP